MMCKKSDYNPEEEQRDHELNLAKIEAEKQMFRESPYLFVFLNLSKSALKVAIWAWFWWLVIR